MQKQDQTGIRLDELRLSSCRYPLGDQWDRVEMYCGEPTQPGGSWCKEHRKRVFSRTTKAASIKDASRAMT
jgi:hypothetical protein